MSPQETLAPIHGTAPVERRILLIEDSEVLSRRLVDLLSDPGSVSVAAHAATQSEAISRLKEDVFDVLVVDIELAEGNGVAVVRNARQLYPPEAQPLIIVLTNYASDFVREHCFAAGADYFLDKMRDISQLKTLVANGRSKWSPPQPQEH
ncbi:MAG TPA: response regulator transcription factor [Steroidobacteraceae bacterium]